MTRSKMSRHMLRGVEALYPLVQPDNERTVSSPTSGHGYLIDQLTHASVTLPARPEDSPFVGREREMAALHAALEHAQAGHGQLVLIAGEPGIGKTYLLKEFAHLAGQHQAHVLWGRCWEGDGAPAFWPWVQIVRAYVQDCPPDLLLAEMAAGAADIAQVVAEVRERAPDLPAAPRVDPESARFRFFDSLTTFLQHAGRRQPL